MATKKPLIGFIGQGWIGRAYADNFEMRGYETIRYGLEKEYVGNKNKIKECDIVFVAVWTPTTPDGFDDSIIRSVLSLVGKGKIAVIKSTILPGTTVDIQKQFPDIIVLYSPEFLSIASHVHDAAHPFASLIGMSVVDARHLAAAESVMKVIPRAPFSQICTSTEAELFKYSHNASGYMQIIFFNVMYDLAEKLGANWNVVQGAIQADPFISNRYANPVHKTGRGAGGGCFIKDIAALRGHIKKHLPHDAHAHAFFDAAESKNIELLLSTNKDLDLLEGVYGRKSIQQKKKSASNRPQKKTSKKRR
jgi:UDPglucose 6-dehydrogenase